MSISPPMSPRCQLTPKDFSFLEEMLDKAAGSRDEGFLRLLRRKLSAAIIVFPDDLDARVAAINSRVDFTVNDAAPEDCILVHDDAGDAPGTVLPVTTRWGLALLGLAAGETIAVEDASGAAVRLQLRWVEQLPQPSARANAGEKRGSGATVVDFARPATRPRKAPRRSPTDADPSPDDDPGPSAA